jgi:hypothetical protein
MTLPTPALLYLKSVIILGLSLIESAGVAQETVLEGTTPSPVKTVSSKSSEKSSDKSSDKSSNEKQKKIKNKKIKISNKVIDGSEALDRFTTPHIQKSKYSKDGKPLEVDTD